MNMKVATVRISGTTPLFHPVRYENRICWCEACHWWSDFANGRPVGEMPVDTAHQIWRGCLGGKSQRW